MAKLTLEEFIDGIYKGGLEDGRKDTARGWSYHYDEIVMPYLKEEEREMLAALNTKINTDIKPKMPKPPLSSIIKEGSCLFCDKCGSTVLRSYFFFGLYGRDTGCIQPECENYYKKKN